MPEVPHHSHNHELHYDHELVTLLSGREDHQVEPMTIALNSLLAPASRRLNDYAVSAQEHTETVEARDTTYRMLGWNRPDHFMHHAYRRILSNTPRGIPPANVVATVNWLRALHGAEEVQAQLPHLTQHMQLDPATLHTRYSYLLRLGSVFDWGEADIHHMLRQRPEILLTARKTLYLYARIIAQHHESLGLDGSVESVLQSKRLRHQPQRLMAWLADTKSIKRTGAGQHEAFSNFLQALNNPRRMRRAGHAVVRAYFMSKPIRNAALLREYYPNLRPFNARTYRNYLAATENRRQTVDAISINEPWLTQLALPAQSFDIAELNRYMHEGSLKLRNTAISFQYDRDKVLVARQEFYRQLGWFDGQHPLHEVLTAMQKTNDWLIPANTVAIIRVLSRYTANVLQCVRRASLGGLRTAPETMEYKIQLIKTAYRDEADPLARWPTLITKGKAGLQQLSHDSALRTESTASTH